VIEVEFEQNGELVILHLTKGVLVMPRSVFIEALKRGKSYRRCTSFEARTTPVPYEDIPQAPQEITNGHGNDLVCARKAEPQAPPADRHASLAAVRRETFPNRKHVTPNAKEHIMAVFLTIELPASEIGETGYLRDIDYLQLPASHVKVVALEADGTWIGVREWSALEAPPPYQRARVEVSLEPGPTPLTATNVVTLAKGAQAILDNFGTAGARR
jgi:hypothetical protein